MPTIGLPSREKAPLPFAPQYWSRNLKSGVELRRATQRILRLRSARIADAVRPAPRKFQIVRAIDRQRRRARPLGRRYGPDHLRDASRRVPALRQDVLSASDRTRAYLSALRAGLRVHARSPRSRNRSLFRSLRLGFRARGLFRD